MRKKLIFVLMFVFSFFIFSNTLNANVERVSINGGASIRVKTETSEQGLRFTAKLNDRTDVVEHGFYLIYGEASLSKLQEEVNKGGKIFINDKEVFKVPVEGFQSDDTFSVVLTGIPEKGYLDSITAVAYAKVGDSYSFSKSPTTRSIAEVAVNLKNSSDYHEAYDEIISAVSDVKRIVSDDEGNVILASGIMETNPENLKLEFIKDWSKMFDVDLGDFDAYGFYSEARLPLLEENEEENKVILQTNLFKFFTERANEAKWGWLLDLLMSKAGDNVTLFVQIEGIFHGGAHGNGYNLYNGKHLAFSIANFFNGEGELPEGAADFSDKDSYANLEEANTGVIINPKNYENLYNKNDSIRLPQPTKIPQGYNFAHYLIDGEKVSVGQEYLLKNDDVVFELVFNPINYFIRFYEGTNELSAFRETYTIEKSIELFVPEKNGFEFLGWYLNSGLTGEVITCIEEGNIGHISLYAKWDQLDVGPTDEQLVSEAQDALELSYASGDSVSSVTKNLTLPLQGLNNAVITWNSSNAAVISNAGVVVRAQANTNVTLTATIKVGAASVTKQFAVTVKAAEPVVDPNQEYTIKFNLNGGAWPTTGGTPGYTNRNTMMTDFLTDWYNFLKPSGVSLNDFMHGKGKTSGFDGLYAEIKAEEDDSYFYTLYAANTKGVDAGTGKFINQPQYNKWVPLIDLFDAFVTAVNPNQAAWSSPWTGLRRIKGFIQGTGYAQEAHDLAAVIPDKLKGSTPGVAIEVPSKYKATDEITLPSPTKASDNFLGWYDNADYQGSAITKIAKGSTGNKEFYARYASTVVPEKPLTDAEKMAEAKAALAVSYSSGDNANSVKGKVTLVAKGKHDVAVTWASSNTAVISNAGAVTRSKDGDVTVTLTATLKIGSLTETKAFTLKVIKVEPEPDFYTIKFVLNGGSFVISGFKNKTELADAFLADLYAFVSPSENLATFKHGTGKTSGFNGLWYSNEEYRAKIYGASIKSGNNNYFLSHSTYQAKWKPFADMMEVFVKVNPEQDFWSSPFTGNLRMNQYFTNTKPAGFSDDDMAMMPKGLQATVIPDKYTKESATITFPIITRNGYEFEGWYDNDKFTGSKVTSIPKGSTGNKTLYAKWGEVTTFKITYHLNSGAFTGYSNKTQIFNAFTEDLFNFINPGGTVAAFRNVWYTNEEHRAKIYAANTKSGNNNYFLSSSAYQAKWKPLADFMVQFVKVGNPDQDFWASPYTGTLRLKQYFANEKPGGAWGDADMNKLPSGLAANVYYQYDVNSPAITLPTATRNGYTFEGWYTANTGGTKVTSIAKGSTGDKVFYARWKEIANPELNTIMNLITGGHRTTLTKKSITYYGATNHAKSLYQFVNRYMFNEPLNIQRKMLATSRHNHPNATATKHWVVIHDTANTNASALANHNFMLNGAGGGYVSWHYTTGNDGIYQGMEDTHRAYHAGDGSSYSVFHNTGISASDPYKRPKLTVSGGYYYIEGKKTSVKAPGTRFNTLGQWPVIIGGKYHINDTRMRYSQVAAGAISMDGGNYNSIGIESSVLRTDDIWWTWHKTAKLTAHLLVKHNLLPDRVAFHNNFDGKACPRTAITSGNINEWLQMIFLEYKIRKSYNSYKIGMVSHSSILNNKGRITSYPGSTTSVSYTVTITAPNGASLSKKFTTSVRV